MNCGITEKILKYRSCSIVGMDKNCGKTVVLNHIISNLNNRITKVAVTSIGVDGEKTDAVTRTAKPEITLLDGMLVATSEMFYNQKRLGAEIVASTNYSTPLGGVLIAEVNRTGRIIVSGPSDMKSTRALIDDFYALGADLVIVDGALSRKTSASPAVTESVVLCTGAAVSLSVDELVRKTNFTYKLISLNVADNVDIAYLGTFESGVWVISDEDKIYKGADTFFAVKEKLDDMLKYGSRLFFSGIVTDNVLSTLLEHVGENGVKEVIVRDFTKIFVTPQNFNKFTIRGGRFSVLYKTELCAVCVNPTAPSGHILDSDMIVSKLQQSLGVEVYDVMRDKNNQ